MAVSQTPAEIVDVNRRYHDATADEYDGKWGISFGDAGRRQVLGKLAKLLGAHPGPFARSLEIGAGTGYFTLNLLQDGIVREATCTDISAGMLHALEANAARLGLSVDTVACDAAELPFADDSFDLVLGHAVLHHLPFLDRAFAELHRVLRPGGVLYCHKLPNRLSWLEAIARRSGRMYFHGQLPDDRLYDLSEARRLVERHDFEPIWSRRMNMLPLTLTGRLAERLAPAIWLANRALSRVPLLNKFATNVELSARRSSRSAS